MAARSTRVARLQPALAAAAASASAALCPSLAMLPDHHRRLPCRCSAACATGAIALRPRSHGSVTDQSRVSHALPRDSHVASPGSLAGRWRPHPCRQNRRAMPPPTRPVRLRVFFPNSAPKAPARPCTPPQTATAAPTKAPDSLVRRRRHRRHRRHRRRHAAKAPGPRRSREAAYAGDVGGEGGRVDAGAVRCEHACGLQVAASHSVCVYVCVCVCVCLFARASRTHSSAPPPPSLSS